MMNKRPMKGDMHQGSNSHWSDLPLPLLELILKRLPVQDSLRFGAVCCSWRNAEKHQFYSPASQLPWLMLRQASHDTTSLRRFFNISEKRIYKRNIPEILLHASVLSTCQKWLRTNGKFLLTPSNNVQFLPTPTDPDGILIFSNKSFWGFTSFFYNRLKDLKFGERYCKTFNCKTHVHGRFISCKGKLYGLDMKYNLVVVDLLHGHHVDEDKDEDEMIEMIEIPQLFHWNDSILLVESCGEILLVRVRGGKRSHMEPEEYSFEVYHANLSRMEWEKIENLGDRILFLSEYGISISVSAAEAGGRGNCVYYIPKHISRKWLEFEFGSGKPPEVHSLDDYDDGDIEKFWVTPSF